MMLHSHYDERSWCRRSFLKNDSTRARSSADVKPHQTGKEYRRREMMAVFVAVVSGDPMPTKDTESMKGVVAQAQDSVYKRRNMKVASEDDSKDQHLHNSFNILKRWRTAA